MPYYGQGDYYATGGLLDVVKGIGRAAIGFATGGPVGAAATLVGGRSRGSGGVQLQVPARPGITIRPGAILPGGQPFISSDMPRKRRRMNPANAKALRRAGRRVDSFVRLAKSSLKHTNYKIVSKSAGKARGKAPNVVVETGPGSVRT